MRDLTLYLQSLLLVLFFVSGTAPLSAENGVWDFLGNQAELHQQSSLQVAELQQDVLEVLEESASGQILEVESDQHYFVGSQHLLVHNGNEMSSLNRQAASDAKAACHQTLRDDEGRPNYVIKDEEDANSSSGQGGRLGGPDVRAQNQAYVDAFKDQGYNHVAGVDLAEEYIPDTGNGATYVYITLTMGGSTVQIQTVDTYADGVTLKPNEAAAAARIRARFPNDTLILIPKLRK